MLHKNMAKLFKNSKGLPLRFLQAILRDQQLVMSRKDKKNSHIFYPMGKPRTSHLLCCQGFGVDHYSLTLGRLGARASSTFATLGLTLQYSSNIDDNRSQSQPFFHMALSKRVIFSRKSDFLCQMPRVKSLHRQQRATASAGDECGFRRPEDTSGNKFLL